MTTLDADARPSRTGGTGTVPEDPETGPPSVVAGTTEEAGERVPLLARPLASYYLILSTSGLLLALGLVMVLSASSIVAYASSGSPWGYFAKQALWISNFGSSFPCTLSKESFNE